MSRSEEHTSELQSPDCISDAVFCFINIFFNDTATTEIYTLSLHDALPILKPNASGDAASSNAARPGVAHSGARCLLRTAAATS